MAGLLAQAGFAVCGCADTGGKGIELYRQLKPDVVTMDMTLPDIDGLACSREILRQDPQARIVMVSAMKDEALMASGYAAGLKGFVQKPPRPAELVGALCEAWRGGGAALSWRDKYLRHFEDALQENLRAMLGVESTLSTAPDGEAKFVSQGLAVIVGLTGAHQGRVILDSSEAVAAALAGRMLGGGFVSEEDVLNGLAELANVVSGNGVSRVNDSCRGRELRLTPPNMLCGRAISILNPKLDAYIVTAETPHGSIRMSVGFAGGNEAWMPS